MLPLSFPHFFALQLPLEDDVLVRWYIFHIYYDGHGRCVCSSRRLEPYTHFAQSRIIVMACNDAHDILVNNFAIPFVVDLLLSFDTPEQGSRVLNRPLKCVPLLFSLVI